MMKIAIGCDHGGFILKQGILDFLKQREIEVTDFGTFDEKSVDYPVYGKKVAQAVASGEVDKGILLCGTGIGISIAANKVRGIRAAVVTDEFCAEACKAHNNANVLALGGRVVSPELAVKLVAVWLDTEFGGERHQRRIDMISDIEAETMK